MPPPLIEQVKETAAAYQLFDPSDRILVALSGGSDSVALLLLLVELRAKREVDSVRACYINHGIRKLPAKREELFCQKLCAKLKVELTIIRENVPAVAKAKKLSLEEAGREIRYAALEELAVVQDSTRVALGHHRDDQVETILFRLFRGTGPVGVLGMPARRGLFIRPILDIPKSSLIAYLKKRKQKWCEDSSNKSLDFSRNVIRQKLIPLIREKLNPAVDEAVLRFSELLSEEQSFFERVVALASRESLSISPGGKILLDCKSLRGYHKALRRRLLRQAVQRISGGQSALRQGIEQLEMIVETGQGEVSLKPHLQAAATQDRLVMWRQSVQPFSYPLQPKSTTSVPELNMSISLHQVGVPAQPNAGKGTVFLDQEKLDGSLLIRQIKNGDSFVPLGAPGNKKVGDYLTDQKIPKALRDEIAAVCDKTGIVWLIGHEIADRVKITSKTSNASKLVVKHAPKTSS